MQARTQTLPRNDPDEHLNSFALLRPHWTTRSYETLLPSTGNLVPRYRADIQYCRRRVTLTALTRHRGQPNNRRPEAPRVGAAAAPVSDQPPLVSPRDHQSAGVRLTMFDTAA
jgi:hypothetical protein